MTTLNLLPSAIFSFTTENKVHRNEPNNMLSVKKCVTVRGDGTQSVFLRIDISFSESAKVLIAIILCSLNTKSFCKSLEIQPTVW